MPTYCYRDIKDGTRVELVFPIGKAPERIESDGGDVFERDYETEMASVSVPATSGWPIECLGSGVNASQAGELRDHFKKVGVPTHVTADGNPVYRNASHRKKALKSRGFVDKASYI